MEKALAAVLGLTRTTIPASRDNPRAKAVNSIRRTIPGKAEARGGRDTAENGSSNGSSHQNSNALDRGEKTIDTCDRGVGESESSEKSESSDTDKTFKASLMDTGLKAGESPSAHGTPGQPPSGTPPGHHYGWEKGSTILIALRQQPRPLPPLQRPQQPRPQLQRRRLKPTFCKQRPGIC